MSRYKHPEKERMLIAKSYGETSSPVAAERRFDHQEPPPSSGQLWRARSGRQTVEVFRLSADGFVTLMVREGPAKGSTIIKEFWQLHRLYTCVEDVKRMEG